MFYGQVKIWVGPLDGDIEERVGGRNKGALREWNGKLVKNSGPDSVEARQGGLTTVGLWMAMMMAVLL